MSNDELKTNAPLILAIETATRAGGVAVARGETILATVCGDSAVSHSTNLLEMIDEALRDAGVELPNVDLFAVAVGPGSFTGLRIGLATVKAFAVHLHRTIVGVSTLAAVAHAARFEGGVVSLLRAGRGEVFAQRFSVREGRVSAEDDAQHLTPDAVTEKYKTIPDLKFTGEGAEVLESFGIASAVETDNRPLAASIAVLGFRAFTEGKSVAAEDLHAVYVRASDAEINERWQQQKPPQQTHS